MIPIPPALRRFVDSEEGGATIEFVLLFPFFVALFLAIFEMGMMLARQMMLDRGLDIAVREVRLGTLEPVTHETLKAAICAHAAIIPDCLRQVRVEMRSADPRNWTQPGASADGADCVNRADTAKPVRFFVPGRPNELMMIRVCALFDPYLPTSAIGHRMSAEKGYYELIATSAFVIEPS